MLEKAKERRPCTDIYFLPTYLLFYTFNPSLQHAGSLHPLSQTPLHCIHVGYGTNKFSVPLKSVRKFSCPMV